MSMVDDCAREGREDFVGVVFAEWRGRATPLKPSPQLCSALEPRTGGCVWLSVCVYG